MAIQNAKVERRVTDFQNSDTRTFVNTTGRTLYHNEVVLIASKANRGMAAIVDAGNVDGTVAANATCSLIVKGIFEIPISGTAFTVGQCVQLAESGTGATNGATASGLYAIGSVVEAVATSASYVKCDLNFGPDAFYVW